MTNTRRGRPKTPILSHDNVVRTSLKIVDEDGLESLTTRRLAAELGVRGASLYNHFANKDEILAAVVDLVLTESSRRRHVPNGDPRRILLWASRSFRDALMAHPNMLPVMAGTRTAGFGRRAADVVHHRLVTAGVSSRRSHQAMEAIERWTVGWVMREIVQRESAAEGSKDAAERALPKATFDAVASAIIDTVIGGSPGPRKKTAARATT